MLLSKFKEIKGDFMENNYTPYEILLGFKNVADTLANQISNLNYTTEDSNRLTRSLIGDLINTPQKFEPLNNSINTLSEKINDLKYDLQSVQGGIYELLNNNILLSIEQAIRETRQQYIQITIAYTQGAITEFEAKKMLSMSLKNLEIINQPNYARFKNSYETTVNELRNEILGTFKKKEGTLNY